MRAWVLLVCGIGVALLGGCGGGDTERVTGTVRLDGEPLGNAELEFTPQEGGRPAFAVTDDEGNFELVYTVNKPGAPEGEYVVRITTATSKTGEDGQDIAVPERLPPKYHAQSTLVREVKAGERNHFEFDLESAQ